MPRCKRKYAEKGSCTFQGHKRPIETFHFLTEWLLIFYFIFLIAQCNPFTTRLETFGYKEIVDYMEQYSTPVIISQLHRSIKTTYNKSCIVATGKSGSGTKAFHNLFYESRVSEVGRDVIVKFLRLWRGKGYYLCTPKRRYHTVMGSYIEKL